MELIDTIELMIDDNYINRFKAEYYQLAIRCKKLNKVINDSITDGDFIPPYTVNNENKGTFMSVQESTEDAYDLELVGMLQPSNCTYSIHIIAQINDAKIKVVET